MRGTFLKVPGQSLNPSIWEPIQISESSKERSGCWPPPGGALSQHHACPWRIPRDSDQRAASPMAGYGLLKTPPLVPQAPAHHPHRAGRLILAVGSCLLCYVEGVAVGLRVQPAAAEGLPQDGVIGFLDALWGAQRHAGGTRRRKPLPGVWMG